MGKKKKNVAAKPLSMMLLYLVLSANRKHRQRGVPSLLKLLVMPFKVLRLFPTNSLGLTSPDYLAAVRIPINYVPTYSS